MFYSSISATTVITTIIGNQASFNSALPLVKRIQNQGAAKYVTKNFKKSFLKYIAHAADNHGLRLIFINWRFESNYFFESI